MTINYKKLPNLDDGNEAMTIRRIETGKADVFVPISSPSCLTNRDYIAYQEWLDAGNTPQAAD